MQNSSLANENYNHCRKGDCRGYKQRDLTVARRHGGGGFFNREWGEMAANGKSGRAQGVCYTGEMVTVSAVILPFAPRRLCVRFCWFLFAGIRGIRGWVPARQRSAVATKQRGSHGGAETRRRGDTEGGGKAEGGFFQPRMADDAREWKSGWAQGGCYTGEMVTALDAHSSLCDSASRREVLLVFNLRGFAAGGRARQRSAVATRLPSVFSVSSVVNSGPWGDIKRSDYNLVSAIGRICPGRRAWRNFSAGRQETPSTRSVSLPR
jgi:hypothetical protein